MDVQAASDLTPLLPSTAYSLLFTLTQSSPTSARFTGLDSDMHLSFQSFHLIYLRQQWDLLLLYTSSGVLGDLLNSSQYSLVTNVTSILTDHTHMTVMCHHPCITLPYTQRKENRQECVQIDLGDVSLDVDMRLEELDAAHAAAMYVSAYLAFVCEVSISLHQVSVTCPYTDVLNQHSMRAVGMELMKDVNMDIDIKLVHTLKIDENMKSKRQSRSGVRSVIELAEPVLNASDPSILPSFPPRLSVFTRLSDTTLSLSRLHYLLFLRIWYDNICYDPTNLDRNYMQNVGGMEIEMQCEMSDITVQLLLPAHTPPLSTHVHPWCFAACSMRQFHLDIVRSHDSSHTVCVMRLKSIFMQDWRVAESRTILFPFKHEAKDEDEIHAVDEMIITWKRIVSAVEQSPIPDRLEVVLARPCILILPDFMLALTQFAQFEDDSRQPSSTPSVSGVLPPLASMDWLDVRLSILDGRLIFPQSNASNADAVVATCDVYVNVTNTMEYQVKRQYTTPSDRQ